NGNRQTRARGILEANILDPVNNLGGAFGTDYLIGFGDQFLQTLFVLHVVHKAHFFGKDLVEQNASDGGLDQFLLFTLDELDLDLGMQVHRPQVVRQGNLVKGGKDFAFAALSRALHREIVAAQHHVLGRLDNRLARGRLEQVGRAQHERARFVLGALGKRHVDRHLVAVKVGVKGGADERVNLDGAALDQHDLKRLDAQPVQSRRAVQQHGMVFDDGLEHIPDFGGHAVHQAFRALDIVRKVVLDQL